MSFDYETLYELHYMMITLGKVGWYCWVLLGTVGC